MNSNVSVGNDVTNAAFIAASLTGFFDPT